MRSPSKSGLRPVDDACGELLEQLDCNELSGTLTENSQVVPTGIEGLDDALGGGLRSGRALIVAGDQRLADALVLRLVVLSKNPAILIGGDTSQTMRMLLAAASRVPEVILKRRSLSDRDWKLILNGVSSICGRGHQILDSSDTRLFTREQVSGQLVAGLTQVSDGDWRRDQLIQIARTKGAVVVGAMSCEAVATPPYDGSFDLLRLKGSMLNARVEGTVTTRSPGYCDEPCVTLEHEPLSMWMAEEVEY